MLVLEMGPSGLVSVSIKQRVFDPDTDPDPEDSIASSLAASRGDADQGPANGIDLFLCPRLRPIAPRLHRTSSLSSSHALSSTLRRKTLSRRSGTGQRDRPISLSPIALCFLSGWPRGIWVS
jgi:hypothetical protein